MRKFIITIDTEGDNLWDWKPGMPIGTENINYLLRFQELCENFGFKPVWLTNYEMLNDTRYVDFISKVIEKDTGELGMHLHAWNTPPEYELPIVQSGHPYLIEYPIEVMEEKIATMTTMIKERCGVKPISHRAGRWAMNQNYFDLLIKYGYEIDCSVTPHVNWMSSVGRTYGAYGSDYSNMPEKVYMVENSEKTGKIMEVPMTIRHKNIWITPEHKTLKEYVKSIYRTIKGVDIWMRPTNDNLNGLKKLILTEKKAEYIMFMLHSSELMPGGSPTFKSKESIEKLYVDLNVIFSLVAESFEGCTLKEFYYEKLKEINKIV